MTSTVTPAQVARFAAFFSGNPTAYGQMWCDPVTGAKQKVKTQLGATSPEMIAAHLAGDGPVLGVIPIRADHTVVFGLIDIDDDGIDLVELEQKVAAKALPLVVCRSKSGGAHCYCFLREPVAARLVIDALKRWRAELGHEKNANGLPVEIFPKQAKLVDSIGNWVNVPYYDHETTQLRYAIGPDGERLSLDGFFAHAVARSTGEHGITGWADPALGPFADGPPCLQTLHKEGFPPGNRNTGLLNVGTFLKLSNPLGWEDALVSYNEGLPEPLGEREVRDIIRHLSNKEYAYTCEQAPLQPRCEKKRCKTQPHGIEYFIKKSRKEDRPPLSHLVKIKTEPPRYRLTVNEDKVLSLSAEELQSPLLMKRALFERLNLVMSLPKMAEWDEELKVLVDGQIEEDAPLEASERGLLLTFLKDFLRYHTKADDEADVLRGLPWVNPNDQRVYFKATAFMEFLAQRRFRAFDIHELYTILADGLALTYAVRAIKGTTVNLWSVPLVADEQLEPFSIPSPKHAGIY